MEGGGGGAERGGVAVPALWGEAWSPLALTGVVPAVGSDVPEWGGGQQRCGKGQCEGGGAGGGAHRCVWGDGIHPGAVAPQSCIPKAASLKLHPHHCP